jgi:hypothetical protein
MSGPTRSPASSNVVSEVPGTRFSLAASVKFSTQPNTDRNGMYSPKGTSRCLR